VPHAVLCAVVAKDNNVPAPHPHLTYRAYQTCNYLWGFEGSCPYSPGTEVLLPCWEACCCWSWGWDVVYWTAIGCSWSRICPNPAQNLSAAQAYEDVLALLRNTAIRWGYSALNARMCVVLHLQQPASQPASQPAETVLHPAGQGQGILPHRHGAVVVFCLAQG